MSTGPGHKAGVLRSPAMSPDLGARRLSLSGISEALPLARSAAIACGDLEQGSQETALALRLV